MHDLPRVAGVLIGDIERQAGARIKYGGLFEALGQRLPLAAVYDAGLRGPRRLLIALKTIHPERHRWRELFHKNSPAFRVRSRQASRMIAALDGRVDVILQVGGLLDARWNDDGPPSVIYTDYTASLSARRPYGGRSRAPRDLDEWLQLEVRAYRRAAHVCTRSDQTRRSIIDDYGLAEDTVTAIGGGVNFSSLPPLPRALDDRPPTALFVGVELFRKGGDVLLEAFQQVRRRLPDARLILLTGEPIPKGLPLDGVQVLPPSWDRARIANLYASADVFVLPSRLETWGDVLLEAMAHGLPCVGVEGDAMTEIIDPGRTGLLVPPEDPDRLADALAELLADPERRREWGSAARRRVEADFTWERVVERLLPHLQAAARGGG